MILGKLHIPQVVRENLTDMIKLYVRYGPDYNLISKEFELMVQQKVTTKFITQFCFELNKKTYALVLDYLQNHKDAKGESEISYDDLWPQSIDDFELRTQIENIPTKILRSLNKDISQAYHLLMESFSDQSLEKLFRYERIRDLYHFMTEIILKKNLKSKNQRKQKKDHPKEPTQKKHTIKTPKSSEKLTENISEDLTGSQLEWSFLEERYLCALYLEKSLLKCCQKLKEKFGEREKWSTTKKVFKKAEQIFQKSLRKAFKFSQLKSLKETLNRLKMTKQNLISEIVKKKSNQIEKYVMKFYKTVDGKKKTKNLEEISKEALIILEVPGDVKKEPITTNETELKEEEINKEVNKEVIKEEVSQQKVGESQEKVADNQSIEIDSSSQSVQEGDKIAKVESGDDKEQESKEDSKKEK